MVDILLLEDSPLDAELLEAQLRRAGLDHAVERVDTQAGFAEALARRRYDVILADYSLPGFDGAVALAMAREAVPATPFIFVSGMVGEEIAIESLKQGATDYVLKHRLQRLPMVVARALAEARERTERQRAEAHQALLVAELSHRVKNTLTTVLSIAHQTLRRSASMAEFEAAFTGRLQALAEAHTLLFRMRWEDVDLADLIGQALRPFLRTPLGRDDTVTLDGPVIRLAPRLALAVSMILHELATNASKYGALGAPAGRVALRWSLDARTAPPRLTLAWTERDGPPVRAPTRKGFGSTLIAQSVAYELDGEVSLQFPETGVVCTLTFPLAKDEPTLDEPVLDDPAPEDPGGPTGGALR